MRRSLPILAAAGTLLACGGGAQAPLGQLETPVAVAVHQASNRVFIANQGSDELKIFDPEALGGSGSFVLGPAVLFALSIPTVPAPAALGAAGRYLFVLSQAGSEVGFVDLEAEGAFGPRSVDGPDGFPITQALPFGLPVMTAFQARFAAPGASADHALVAGLSSATGGALVALRPPGAGGEPALVARVELPEEFPAHLALDPTGAALALDGPTGPIDDCRAVAISDQRYHSGDPHEPGVTLTRVAVSPDGALRVDAPGTAGTARLTVRVPLTLLDGTLAVRAAPVKAAAFVPAPLEDAALAAITADPCVLRSGRLVVLLDEGYCHEADLRTCPDVAMIDLPSGQLATDLASGPALYAIPGSALGVKVLAGPFSPVRAFPPVVNEGEEEAAELDDLPALAMVTSANGGVYFFAPGFGSYLRGPTAADRADADRVYALDADREGPRAGVDLVRTDARRRLPPELSPPTIDAAGARPRDERWTAGFLAPLPGLGDLPPIRVDGSGVATVTLPASAGKTFLSPVAVLASADPAVADRVVPRPGTVNCPGHRVTAVSADGRTLTLERVEQTGVCDEPGLPLAVVPGEATPWWLEGDVTGFAGRLPPEGGEVWAGATRLFAFTPPPLLEEGEAAAGWTPEQRAAAPGATWSFGTDAGFTAYGAFPETDFQLPVDIDAWLEEQPTATGGPEWRVFVPYVGGDALIEFDPEAPPPLSRLRAFQ